MRQEIALDLMAVQHQGGPCLDSYGTGRPVPPVAISVAHAASRWPDFTERALRHDIASTFAVPLRRRETLLGALNVFVPTLPEHTDPPEDDWSVRLAQVLADAAAVGLQNHRVYDQYRTLAGQLQGPCPVAYASSRPRACSPSAGAPGSIRRSSRCASTRAGDRLPLDEVATGVIEGSVDRDELGGGPETAR